MRTGGLITRIGGQLTRIGGKLTRIGGQLTRIGGMPTRTDGQLTRIGGLLTRIGGQRARRRDQTPPSGSLPAHGSRERRASAAPARARGSAGSLVAAPARRGRLILAALSLLSVGCVD